MPVYHLNTLKKRLVITWVYCAMLVLIGMPLSAVTTSHYPKVCASILNVWPEMRTGKGRSDPGEFAFWDEVRTLNDRDEQLKPMLFLQSDFSFGEILIKRKNAEGNFTTNGSGITPIVSPLEETPGIQLPRDTIIQCGEGIPPPQYASLAKLHETEFTVSEETNMINTCSYTLTRTYHFKKNSTSFELYRQRITVIDTIAPTITVVNPLFAFFADGGELAMFGNTRPEISPDDVELHDDCCDPSLEIRYQLTDQKISDIMGPYRRWKITFVATDLSGNSTQQLIYIIQYDSRNG